MTNDLYDVLGVSRTASADVIRKAYRRRAMANHPDRNPGDDAAALRFHLTQTAHDVLTDPARRARYDKDGSTDAAPADTMVLAKLAEVIVPIMFRVVETAGNHGNYKRAAIVTRITDEVKTLIRQAQEQLKKVETGAKILKDVAARFSCAGGVNLFAEAALSTAKANDALAESIRADLEKFDRALDYLKTCKYRTDDPFAGMTSVTGVPLESWKWIATGQ